MGRLREAGMAALAALGIGGAAIEGKALYDESAANKDKTTENKGALAPDEEGAGDTGGDTGTDAERPADPTQDFADALVEALDESNLNCYVATLPDGSIEVEVPGESKFSLELKRGADDKWYASPTRELLTWAIPRDIHVQSVSLDTPEGINTAIADMRDLNELATQARDTQMTTSGFETMIAKSISAGMSAEQVAKLRTQELINAEQREKRLQEDISYALHEGENVFILPDNQ